MSSLDRSLDEVRVHHLRQDGSLIDPSLLARHGRSTRTLVKEGLLRLTIVALGADGTLPPPSHRWANHHSGARGGSNRQCARDRVSARPGSSLQSYTEIWSALSGEFPTRRAGLVGMVPHDFRRTAVRNFERAGVPRSVAMKLIGHKTAMYRRYAIVSPRDLTEGVAKLALSRGSAGSSERVVLPFGHNDGHNRTEERKKVAAIGTA